MMKLLERNREIDYKKVISICMLIVLAMIGYEAIKYNKNRNFTKLNIVIQDDGSDRQLLDNGRVLKLMRQHLGFDPSVANIEEVDFRSLEEGLEANPYIQQALVYLNARHELHVVIKQRKPIARVKTASEDFYVAADGNRIPLSSYSTLRVPVVTGYVQYIDGNTPETKKRYNALIKLLNICSQDQFLSALIEQLDFDRHGKLTLIPKLGHEKIVFGEIENIEEKFDKLDKYYKWGRAQDGWEKYAYLNLEIPNQIALGK